MLLSKNAKIEAVCSKDETRQHLGSPYLDLTEADKPRLVATNGHSLVALSVQKDEHDTTGFVSVDALKAVRKAGPHAEMVCNGACAVPGGASFPRPDVGTFPEWRQVMPKEAGDKEIGFDVRLLKAIVDACGGSGNVRLTFGDPAEPITVHVYDAAQEHIAVLMPVRI